MGYLSEEQKEQFWRDGVLMVENAVTPEQLMHTADRGGFLPPKSTWIEPKLRSGLFIHEIQ